MIRQIKWFWQRITRGFDDRATWNLEITIAKFILPRLKLFKEKDNGYPGSLTEKEWDDVLDDMIYAMEFHAGRFTFEEPDEKNYARVTKGTADLGKYFGDLWW